MTLHGTPIDDSAFSRLADWAASPQEIPEEVRERARLAILDTVGTTIAARISPDSDQIAAFVEGDDAADDAPLIGRGGWASTTDAAFVNSFLAHLLDFDDSHGDMAGHPTAVVLPAALSIAHRLDLPFAQVVDAYIIGVEVISRLGRALNPDHYDHGWHPTATIGVFGAAAAAARLLRLTPAQTQSALSLAAAFSSGIKASFGTSAKPLQVARSAASGAQAALLAQSGATGRADAFEHAQGYARVFEGKDGLHVDTSDLGTRWSLVQPGIIIKQYPCCGSTHSAIESAVALAPLRAEQIERVLIRLHPRRRGHVDRPRPTTELDAKFSVQYTVSRALLSGEVTLADFIGAAHTTDEAVSMLAKTVVEDMDAPDNAVEDRYVASVTVRLTDGRELSRFTPVASGRRPGEMLPADRIVAKFENCVRPQLGEDQTDRLRALVLGAGREQVREVLRLTRPR